MRFQNERFLLAEISTNYGVLLYPILGIVARCGWLGSRTAARAKLSNTN